MKLSNSMDLVKLYQEREKRAIWQNNRFEINLKWLSIARLIFFLIFLYTGIQTVRSDHNRMIWVGVLTLSIILFLWSITKFQKIQLQYNHLKAIITINNNEISTLAGKGSIFDDGTGFPSNTTYIVDLDILGKHSLYHYLNRCGTWEGKNHLFQALIGDNVDIRRIQNTQMAVAELAKELDFRQDFLAKAMLSTEDKKWDSLTKWMQGSSAYIQKKIWHILLVVWPVISLLLLGYLVFTGVYQPFLYWLIGGLLISGSQVKKTNKVHTQVSGYHRQLDIYSQLMQLLAESQWQQQDLQSIRETAEAGVNSLKELAAITKSFDHRLNGIAYIMLNGMGLHDVRSMIRLERWKQANQTPWKSWLEIIGEYELISCLANLQFNHPEFSFPKPVKGSPFISFEDLGHPLIPAHERVCNTGDFGPDKKFVIITGSNMAGKSTFLRTLGINMILGQMGSPVCASQMSFTPMRIFTSLRLSDSLQEHTSFFYAELKKLKEIVSELEKGTHALVLLDEILKGTNSDDKEFGTEQLIRKMIDYQALTFLATHITSLGKLQDTFPGKIENWCFESVIDDGELTFNYKLQPGVAKHKNATFLMRKIGLIEEENKPHSQFPKR